jgi:hypothetical protein
MYTCVQQTTQHVVLLHRKRGVEMSMQNRFVQRATIVAALSMSALLTAFGGGGGG